MLLGIGLDLCQVDRLARAIEKPHFLERVFTPAERARIEAAHGPRRAEIAAGLFAAKEAVAKALGTGFVGFGTADIEIVPDDAGRPTCALRRSAAGRLAELGGATPVVTITHDAGIAAAVALIEAAQK